MKNQRMRLITALLTCVVMLASAMLPASGLAYAAEESGAAESASEQAAQGDSNTEPAPRDNTESVPQDNAVSVPQVEAEPAARDEITAQAEPEDSMEGETFEEPRIISMTATKTGETQALIMWEASAEFSGFEIQYAKNILYLFSQTKIIEDPSATSCVLEDLSKTSRYYIRIRGFRQDGDYEFHTDWVQKKIGKKTDAANIDVVNRNGKPVDVRKQAGKKLKGYTIAQGSCTDGKYVYMAFEKRNGDSIGNKRARVKVAKVRISDWKLVKVSPKGMKLGHANDMTFNTNKKYIVVTGAKKNDPYVRIVDRKTLKKKATKRVRLGAAYKNIKAFNAIDYDAENGTYYIRSRMGGYKVFTLDESFRSLAQSAFVSTWPSRDVQGSLSFGDYFVITQSQKQSSNKNTITIYNKNGEKHQDIVIRMKGEIESIFMIGGMLYATMHKHLKRSTVCYIFRILF